ncbi:MAG: peptidoglycan-binding protein [bacterium]|nr:peptidoglycan-binding protein [bacterium]
MQRALGFWILALLILPLSANAATAAELQAQAQALLAQVAALQAQLGGNPNTNVVPTGNDSSSCPLIGRSLKNGVSGDDVLRLQQFLARDPSIYPEGIASGYYGGLTEKAVQRWQAKYNIVSSGTPATTGYGVVGPRTAAAIALLCTTGNYGGVPGPSVPAVGGFITVTPISGNAPLAVSVTATVNTVSSCAGAIYSLDFGDNTTVQQIPVSAGNCGTLNQTYPHTYQYGGTYQINLSAGRHQTSATVTVSGAGAPPPPVFTPNLPRESFSVSPTSGPAPLSVTFSGTVNSNDAGFCQGGCASTLDFGDGTMASVNLPATVGGWLNYSVTHSYTQSGGYRATLYQGGAGVGRPTVGTETIIVGAAAPPPPPPPPAAYQYSPPIVSPSGADSLSFSVSFDVPSACTGYRLSWGDGSVDISQNDGGSSCAQGAVLKSFTHTYPRNGAYTITLRRGPTLSRTDDVALNISN